MNPQDLSQVLEALFKTGLENDELEDVADELDLDDEVVHELDPTAVVVDSFERAGVMTTDAGFVVTFADGSEFQVTVVQSKVGR